MCYVQRVLLIALAIPAIRLIMWEHTILAGSEKPQQPGKRYLLCIDGDIDIDVGVCLGFIYIYTYTIYVYIHIYIYRGATHQLGPQPQSPAVSREGGLARTHICRLLDQKGHTIKGFWAILSPRVIVSCHDLFLRFLFGAGLTLLRARSPGRVFEAFGSPLPLAPVRWAMICE